MMPSVNHAAQIFPDFAANAVRMTCGMYKSRIFLLSFSCFPTALKKSISSRIDNNSLGHGSQRSQESAWMPYPILKRVALNGAGITG